MTVAHPAVVVVVPRMLVIMFVMFVPIVHLTVAVMVMRHDLVVLDFAVGQDVVLTETIYLSKDPRMPDPRESLGSPVTYLSKTTGPAMLRIP